MHVFAERPSDYGWYLLTFGTFLDEFSPNSPDTIPQRPSAASFESLAERNRESLDSQQMTKCVSEHTHTHTHTHTLRHTERARTTDGRGPWYGAVRSLRSLGSVDWKGMVFEGIGSSHLFLCLATWKYFQVVLKHYNCTFTFIIQGYNFNWNATLSLVTYS